MEGFQRWLKRKKGQVNRYRGGFALNDGLVLEGGTALHWAAYYGQLAIVEALAENGAGWHVLTASTSLYYMEMLHKTWCIMYSLVIVPSIVLDCISLKYWWLVISWIYP